MKNRWTVERLRSYKKKIILSFLLVVSVSTFVDARIPFHKLLKSLPTRISRWREREHAGRARIPADDSYSGELRQYCVTRTRSEAQSMGVGERTSGINSASFPCALSHDERAFRATL